MNFLRIIKPKILIGNLISIVGGFFLASTNIKIDYFLLIFILLGMFLVISSSCVFNNYFDRDIDKMMLRTRNRPLANGSIDLKISLIYAFCLGVIGFFLLYLFSNILVFCFSIIGFLIYVCVYTVYAKRKSIYGIYIGGLSGCIPPLIGYCSISNCFDSTALILLLIFFIWQIPHFYSISIFRIEEYRCARIPILPITNGIFVSKIYICFYILIFTLLNIFFFVKVHINYIYLICFLMINVLWFILAISGFQQDVDNQKFGKYLFIFSIFVIVFLNLIFFMNSINLLI